MIFVFPDDPGTRDFAAWFFLFLLLKHKGIPVVIDKTLGRAGRINSKNYGLKTATKPKEETRSNLENGEFNCVRMSIFETFLYHFILLIILFYLCVSVKWSLNCSVFIVSAKVCLCSTACMFLCDSRC